MVLINYEKNWICNNMGWNVFWLTVTIKNSINQNSKHLDEYFICSFSFKIDMSPWFWIIYHSALIVSFFKFQINGNNSMICPRTFCVFLMHTLKGLIAFTDGRVPPWNSCAKCAEVGFQKSLFGRFSVCLSMKEAGRYSWWLTTIGYRHFTWPKN